MNNSPLSNSLSVSVQIYRALLVAYPKKFRDHYETQMVQVFRDSFREAHHRNGMSGVIDLWLHTCVDLLITAFIERFTERSQYMFSPRIILWGGVASAVSGMFWMMAGNGGAAFVIALALGLGGLVSLYSRLARQGGSLGLAGFALGIIGTVLALATEWWGTTSGISSNSGIEREPVLATQTILILIVAIATLGIGLALLGVANLRATTLPRWRGLPLGLGLLTTILSITLVFVAYVPLSQGRNPFDPWPPQGIEFMAAEFMLLGLGWIGLGITLATEARAQVAQTPPASA